MTLAQDLGNQFAAIRERIVLAADREESDGWVFANQEMFREFNRTKHALVHFAHKNDMTNEEISNWANIPVAEIELLLSAPLVQKVDVGAIVRSKNPDRDPLHCGSGSYLQAVVICMEPFIMVSESADMRWSTWTPDRVHAIGLASTEVFAKCTTRADE